MDAFAHLIASYCGVLFYAVRILLGIPVAANDLTQDIYGAHGLIVRGALYAPPDWAYHQAHPEQYVGMSTHPPTAFLFLIPFAPLSLTAAEQLWAWSTLLAVLVAAWAYGVPARRLPLLVPLVLWPPVLVAVGQFPPLWLLGLALAWRVRRRPTAAGAWIAWAALAKIVPLIVLAWWLRRHRWGALAGAAVTGLGALGLLLALQPTALAQYHAAETGGNVTGWIASRGNGALVPYALARGGLPLAVLAIAALVGAAWLALRRATDDPDAWHLLAWLAVALLPICWTYSVLPLLPGLVRALRYGDWRTRLVAVAALLAPWGNPWPNGPRPGAIALTVALAGVAAVLPLAQSRPHIAWIGVSSRRAA